MSPSMSQSRMSHSVRKTPAPPSPGGLTKCTVSALADGANGERVPATAPVPAAAASVPMKLRRLMDAPDADFLDGFDFLLIFTPHTYAGSSRSFPRIGLHCKPYAEHHPTLDRSSAWSLFLMTGTLRPATIPEIARAKPRIATAM